MYVKYSGRLQVNACIMAGLDSLADGKIPAFDDGDIMPLTWSRINVVLRDPHRARKDSNMVSMCLQNLLHAADVNADGLPLHNDLAVKHMRASENI